MDVLQVMEQIAWNIDVFFFKSNNPNFRTVPYRTFQQQQAAANRLQQDNSNF